MQHEHITLAHDTPGTRRSIQVLRYGADLHGPKTYIQGALHADEVPALVVTHLLRQRLAELENQGQLLGEVLLVPYANPIGLGQNVLGQHEGRFALGDGKNFNRGFADLAPRVRALVHGQLGQDSSTNEALIRRAIAQAAAELQADNPVSDLKRRLMQLAADAHIVLDLHCDSTAVLHLYALTPQVDTAMELAADLQAHAVLLATESGDAPFDEACSSLWLKLQQSFPGHPIPLGCFAPTVELRGEKDTRLDWAAQDCAGLIRFLQRQGVVAGPAPALPQALCQATPLSGSEPLSAPVSGVVVFHAEPGQRMRAGDLVAQVLDPDTGLAHAVHCQSDGVLYARCGSHWAAAGKHLAKIAGTRLSRTGLLLGD
jgi:uncharacterized protein